MLGRALRHAEGRGRQGRQGHGELSELSAAENESDGSVALQAPRRSAALDRQGPLRRRHPLPDLLHVAFVRSPHAHARISGIDATRGARARRRACGAHARRSRAGAREAAHGARARARRQPNDRCGPMRWPTARSSLRRRAGGDRRRRHRYVAEDAAALVDVDYEILPAVTDAARCRAAGCADGARASSPPTSSPRIDGGVRRCRRGVRRRAAHVFARSCFSIAERAIRSSAAASVAQVRAGERRRHGLGLDAEGARSVPDPGRDCSASTKTACAW